MKRLTLPKTKKLTTNARFKVVWARKVRFTDDLLILYLAENDSKIARFGISVNKSIGSAVVRNRLKRLVREAFRQNQRLIPPGFDYLFSFSPKWKDKLIKPANFEIINKSVMALINKTFKKS